jgi:hydrogenase maturation protein HypF
MKERLKIFIKGAVQGVGFRPFIFGLASDLKLTGFVLNSSAGVTIEVEGRKQELNQFLLRIESEKPEHTVIHSMEFSFLDHLGYKDFSIRQSESVSDVSAIILPDIATCQMCREELFDITDRRYLYPFINCTHCGPRFTIIQSLPYDRPNTSMKNFKMCDDCRREYENPCDRRFHAQPVACPACGPQVFLWDKDGSVLASQGDALDRSVGLLNSGMILAIKGLGGFHLVADARNASAVENMRLRKHREEKPFALMFPGMESIQMLCEVSDFEERLLQSPESPIVLLRKRAGSESKSAGPCDFVAPGNPYLGVMLPYTPLHHIIMKQFGYPIVATSGNLSEEPMCIDEQEALIRLAGIADYFLVHDRPIVRPVDDSIVRVIEGRELVLRRARGYAPLPLILEEDTQQIDPQNMSLAVGAHLKNTIAVQKGNKIFLSQHIGDLATQESVSCFENVISDFQRMYQIAPQRVISDLHPEYISTKLAREWYGEVISVQHHEAHIAACRLENQVKGEALGVAWDGTGFGYDNSIWGGEFFLSDDVSNTHYAQMRQFPLIGGDQAIRDPRRSALGILFELTGQGVFKDEKVQQLGLSSDELPSFEKMLIKKLNCPLTSSVGRLFDGVAALLGLCRKINYEGQAAMMLEYLADPKEKGSYHFQIENEKPFRIDWSPVFMGILEDQLLKVNHPRISMKFHRGLCQLILEMVQKCEMEKVILSGGCFQNAILLEHTVQLLRNHGFRPYWHQRIPPNDGGIALGQIALGLLNNKKIGNEDQQPILEKINQ